MDVRVNARPSQAVDPLSMAKAVACCLVIAQHIVGAHFGTYGPGWRLLIVLDSLTRVAVPIFLMTSGAIFLERTDSFSYFYTKRLMRVVLPLVFWSAACTAWGAYNGIETGNWLLAMIHGPVKYHLWYFYAVLALSLITPVLSPWFQTADTTAKWTLVGTWFFFIAVIPVLNGFVVPIYGAQWSTGYAILDFGGYLVLGALLSWHGEPVARLKWLGIALYLAGTASIALTTLLYSKAKGEPNEMFFYNNSAFVIVAATGAFLAFQHLRSPGQYLSALLALISSCSLGIYGIHPLSIEVVSRAWMKLRLTDGAPSTGVLFLLVLWLSLAIVWTLRHVPFFRRVM